MFFEQRDFVLSSDRINGSAERCIQAAAQELMEGDILSAQDFKKTYVRSERGLFKRSL